MRELIGTINPSLWSQMSGLVFGVAFLALVCWVCLPQRKPIYDRYSKLPLERGE